MAMIISHNLAAMNAQRTLKITNAKKQKCMEKLSSGYQINRASDDAARLSITEKMRGQIRGLDQASKNCENGMNLVNIADGGMAEIESILQRTRELCVQAANDTYTLDDREKIAMEIHELTKEVDNIGNHTEYNTIKVLQGSIQKIPVDPYTSVNYGNHPALSVFITDADGNTINCGDKYYLSSPSPSLTLDDSTVISNGGAFILDFSKIKSNADWQMLDQAGFTFNCSLGCKQEFTFIFNASSTGITDKTPAADIDQMGQDNNKVFNVGTKGYADGKAFVNDLISFTKNLKPNGTNVNIGHDNKLGSLKGGTQLVVYGSQTGSGGNGYLIAGKPEVTQFTDTFKDEFQNKELRIQAGANSGQELLIQLPHIDSYSLHMERIDVLTHNTASASITYVDEMIFTVNDERGRMGAYYNRLEYAVAVDNIMNENLNSSESRMRDTNIADEIMNMTKNNILSQAGQSILASANSNVESVLSLLS